MIEKVLDTAEHTDPAHNAMIAYVIVVEPGVLIDKTYNGYQFFCPPTLEDLRQDVTLRRNAGRNGT